jgi:hypothetical protein
MTKRQLILENIRVEVATVGRVTSRAIDFYCTHRISREAFQVAIDRGMQQFREKASRQFAGAGLCDNNGRSAEEE